MILSVLVCSTHNRYKTFLPKILGQLFSQQMDGVEILCFIDNKTRMLGDKRNDMLQVAQGGYVVFVDDDDRIAPTYVKDLVNAICETKVDCITFQAEVTINGGPPKVCIYDHRIVADFNNELSYWRLPNHICCVRTELALQVGFLPVIYGEDSDYSKRLKPLIKTHYHIPKVLYYYDYNKHTTETQTPIARRATRRYHHSLSSKNSAPNGSGGGNGAGGGV